jgi:hypothetical protein
MSVHRSHALFHSAALAVVVASLAQACGGNDATGANQTTIPDSTAAGVSLGVGTNASLDPGKLMQLAGGPGGGEFVLVVTDTAVDGSAGSSGYQLVTSGITSAGSVSAPSTSLSPAPLTAVSATLQPRLDFAFASHLNERAHSRLKPMVPAARRLRQAGASVAGRSLSTSAAPPQIGDILMLNVASSPCDSVVLHPARVVAIGSTSIVVADTLNPQGGFTTADYQRFGARFDTLVYPLDVSNFGAPAVFGAEGKILLFFTRAVNELTPKGSTSYVGGFFFDRDLFPITSTPDAQGCPGSNVGELFYLLTPDPTGIVNGNIRRTGFVDSVTTSVLAHEFQHLINASRRLYVNTSADAFEVVWLNEGLSHIAEELLFYHEGASAPRSNLDVNALRGSVALKDAFNADQSANTARYGEYLAAPSTNSPIRLDDSLGTRGATWDFLRYAADRKLRGGGSESSVWMSLVNSSSSGLTNLKQVFGTNLGTQIRDWSVSQYADDVVAGVNVDFTQASWNWHSIFPALGGGGGTYPLQTVSLPLAGTSGSLIPGASAFYRFSVGANGSASLRLSASTGSASVLSGQVIRIR